MTIKLKKADYERILDHAQSELPNEACGLIAGSTEEAVKIVEKVYLLTNTDKSREHFSIDPREQLNAVKDMRALGLSPLGNFHSHPESPARPSPEDIRLAYDTSASYLILSLEGKEPVLKAFQINGAHVSHETIDII